MPNDNHSTSSLTRHTARAVSELVMETRDIGRAKIETADARQLHAFLENGDAFANWIADRIRQYDFVEGVDYVTYLENAKKGRPSREYAITLDMAKELSMVERNERGKEARRYFIECEKRAKAAVAIRRAVTPRIDLSREHRLTLKDQVKYAKMAGLDGNQALLAANRAAAALTGIDNLGLLGVTHMEAPQQEALLTPTDIGKRIGSVSARTVNLLLCGMGLQIAPRDAKGHIQYEATEAGIEAGGVMLDTGKKHGNGTPVRQLKWSSSIVALVENEMQREEAA